MVSNATTLDVTPTATISSGGAPSLREGLLARDAGTVVHIQGGTILGGSDSTAVEGRNQATVTIDGGLFTGGSGIFGAPAGDDRRHRFRSEPRGDVHDQRRDVQCGGAGTFQQDSVELEVGSLTVNGGTFNHGIDARSGGAIVNGSVVPVGSTLAISRGTIAREFVFSGSDSNLNITGGIFSGGSREDRISLGGQSVATISGGNFNRELDFSIGGSTHAVVTGGSFFQTIGIQLNQSGSVEFLGNLVFTPGDTIFDPGELTGVLQNGETIDAPIDLFGFRGYVVQSSSGVLFVPEPGTLALTGIGALGIMAWGRKARRRPAAALDGAA